ncbi:hypothetical protein EDD22DRAFT_483109 [Suillus occidentalis]|nr:hypothetical protein EDD22DRAFT_483109 [Suillus occidentalis]
MVLSTVEGSWVSFFKLQKCMDCAFLCCFSTLIYLISIDTQDTLQLHTLSPFQQERHGSSSNNRLQDNMRLKKDSSSHEKRRKNYTVYIQHNASFFSRLHAFHFIFEFRFFDVKRIHTARQYIDARLVWNALLFMSLAASSHLALHLFFLARDTQAHNR